MLLFLAKETPSAKSEVQEEVPSKTTEDFPSEQETKDTSSPISSPVESAESYPVSHSTAKFNIIEIKRALSCTHSTRTKPL